MHAPEPWLADAATTRQARPPATHPAVAPWLTEHKMLEILDAFLIACLLAPFLLA
jgi:hypothetical protein